MSESLSWLHTAQFGMLLNEVDGSTAVSVLLMIMVAFGAPVENRDETPLPLTLLKALPIEGPHGLDPSGLTIHDGTLYAVSDKHDTTVFQVEIGPETATFVPSLTIPLEHVERHAALDFEGICPAPEGGFLLVSESHFRVLHVDMDGQHARWVTESLEPIGRSAGLFATYNACFEAIASLDRGIMLLGVERQPCGIITVDVTGPTPFVVAMQFYPGAYSVRPGRTQDIADFVYEEKTLFALHRNAESISTISIDPQGIHDHALWTFSKAVWQPEFVYTDIRFGLAEGLALDRDHIYVVLDNNGTARRMYPDDYRPLLFIFARPK